MAPLIPDSSPPPLPDTGDVVETGVAVVDAVAETVTEGAATIVETAGEAGREAEARAGSEFEKFLGDLRTILTGGSPDMEVPEGIPVQMNVSIKGVPRIDAGVSVSSVPEVKASLTSLPEVRASLDKIPDLHAVVDRLPTIRAALDSLPAVHAFLEKLPEVRVNVPGTVRVGVQDMPEVKTSAYVTMGPVRVNLGRFKVNPAIKLKISIFGFEVVCIDVGGDVEVRQEV